MPRAGLPAARTPGSGAWAGARSSGYRRCKAGRAGPAAPAAAAGGGRAAAGAWSAALPPRRSRKRWKRGWTITATSPALTLLEKLRGKTGAAADSGSSFFTGKPRSFPFHFAASKENKKKRLLPHPRRPRSRKSKN